MSKQKKIIIVVVGVIVLISIAVFRGKFQAKKVQWEKVVKATAVEAVYAIGSVDAVRSFQAKAGVATGISQIAVREGQSVKKGSLLVSFTEGYSISSPLNGVVSRVNYKTGESVFSGNVIVEVIDPSEYEIKAVLDQRAAVKVKSGQIAVLSFDGLRDSRFEGVVRSVYSSQSQFTIVIDPKSLPKQILPGMTADIAIEISKKPEVLMIPIAAVEDKTVERLRGSSQAKVPVKLGLINGEKAEVVEGELTVDDQVAVRMK